MRQFIIKRILISIVVLIGATLLIYVLLRSMPSDFVDLSTAQSTQMTNEQREAMREAYGLNEPIIVGYVKWLGNAFTGNLGQSLHLRRPVFDVLKELTPITVTLALIALVLEIIIAVPLGILAARKQYSKTDYAVVTFAFLCISLPIFFFAAVLKRAFGPFGLNVLPVSGMLTARVTYDSFTWAKLLDYAQHFILPIACFVITNIGQWIRYTRTNMLEVLNADYVRTARAKGLPEHIVINRHAFRNTLIPLVTLLGSQLPVLFSGAAITEGLFSIQGLGGTALTAAHLSDVPYLMGFNLLIVIMTLIGTLLSDILYAVVDPRVRLS